MSPGSFPRGILVSKKNPIKTRKIPVIIKKGQVSDIYGNIMGIH